MRKLYVALSASRDEDNLLDNAWNCFYGNADGIFIVGSSAEELLRSVNIVKSKKKLSGYFVGVNYLGALPSSVARLFENFCVKIDAVWSDNALIRENGDQSYAKMIWDSFKKLKSKVKYFGGVAFKYQKRVEPKDYAKIASISSHYMDVVTTSGEGTGIEAEPEKIRVMAQAIAKEDQYRTLNRDRLAIASGCSAKNARNYPGADCFIVATSLKDKWGNIDRGKVQELKGAIA